MRSSLASLLIALGLLLQPLSPGAAAPLAAPLPQETGPGRVLAEEAGGLRVEWRTPELTTARPEDGAPGAGEVSLSLAGYELDARPGHLALPQDSLLVALPPGAKPEIEILAEETTPADLPGPAARAPQPGEQAGEWAPYDGPLPADPPLVELVPLGVVRGVSLARLVYTPIRPGTSGWVMTEYVSLRLTYKGPATTPAELPRASAQSEGPRPLSAGDTLLDTLRRQVANPTQVVPAAGPLAEAALEGKTGASLDALVGQSASAAGAWALVTDAAATGAAAPGLMQVTYTALNAARYPVNEVDPAYLQIWQGGLPGAGGIEVAAEWEGNDNTSFETSERLIFYAEPRFSRWTGSDVYWLVVGPATGKRISTRPGSPGGLAAGAAWRSPVFEKNLLYAPDNNSNHVEAGRDGDRWYWEDITRPGKFLNNTASYSFQMNSVSPAQPAQLTVHLVGHTTFAANPDHRVEVLLNGTSLGVIDWDGKKAKSGALNIPAGKLLSGANSLALHLPGISGIPLDGFWLDAFEVRYAQGSASLGKAAWFAGEPSAHSYTLNLDSTSGLRVYDVTEPAAPVRLDSSSISVVGNQVSFGDGTSGGRRYAAAAESGLLAPAAIRAQKPLQTAGGSGADYLVITYPDFAPALAPLLALRAGQGLQTAVEDVQAIYDAYGGGRPEPEAIRAYLQDVYQRWNPRPTYVLLVGDGTADPRRYQSSASYTFIPPMLADVDPWAGETASDNRFVTVEGEDALPDMLIGRLPANSLAEAQVMVAKITGYEAPGQGKNSADLVSITDNADDAGDFAAQSEDVLSEMGYPYQAVRAYYWPGLVSIASMQQTARASFNNSATVIMYTGHASLHQWAAENFFHISQLPLLTNHKALPLLLEMSCLTAAFQVPGYETLDEALLRLPGGGIVAAFGATGLGVESGHRILARTILHDLFATTGTQRVGAAALDAKMALAASGSSLDLLDTYVILGDPATLMDVQSVHPNFLFLPKISR